MLEKLTPKQRKLLPYLALFIFVGMGLMLIQPPKPQSTSGEAGVVPTLITSRDPSTGDYTEKIEKKLSGILQQMNGVGQVMVFATLERGPQINIAETSTREDRITEENDRQGGVRTIQDIRHTSSPVTLRNDGRETPLIIEETEPLLRGVLIVAEGADDPQIRWQIAKACQTVLQIPMYKIEVLAKSNKR